MSELTKAPREANPTVEEELNEDDQKGDESYRKRMAWIFALVS